MIQRAGSFRNVVRLAQSSRCFSASTRLREIRDISELPRRIYPSYHEIKPFDLLSLRWPAPPRNILITKKKSARAITESTIEYAKHVHSTYPSISLVFLPGSAAEIHEFLPFPVYTGDTASLPNIVDLVCTLGGDGTILRASALFASSPVVPPILSFSMGSLGFLGEWKFPEYKRAFREVYMSGAGAGYGSTGLDDFIDPAVRQAQANQEISQDLPVEWASLRGKSMGPNRSARILLRNRLKVQLNSSSGQATNAEPIFAMNEVTIHRGRNPHLTILDVFIGGKFLTSAVADGMIVSTPTGSTAYSLSSGGSIVHPLVSSLLLTPICPRSLSFRPLVLPAHSPISLRLSPKNRADEVEVSIDGVRQETGLTQGMEINVWGEGIRETGGEWQGGVPSVVRSGRDGGPDEHWVGGLNGLLKFNYPFGEG
jgi:NADH kinase